MKKKMFLVHFEPVFVIAIYFMRERKLSIITYVQMYTIIILRVKRQCR